jgi:ParB family chromosome partitioning protein
VSIETIHRGLVRIEDKRQVEALRSGANAEDETSCTQESETPSVSQALTEELTAQRTVALSVEMLARPDIALVAITHRLAGHFCYSFSYDPLPTAVMVQPEGYGGDKNDLRTTDGYKAAAKLREHAQKWKDVLPENSSELWDWLIQQPQPVVLRS